MNAMRNSSTLCIIYVSEASNISNLDALKLSIAQTPKFCGKGGNCSLLHSFRDITYNRTSFFLAGHYPDVRACALELCRAAFQSIDFRSHRGTHPTLGTVDNICFSPLGEESLDIVSSQARDFGAHLFDLTNVPVYFYGSASTIDDADRQIHLKSIRRQFGYFGEKSQPQEVEPSITANLGPSWDKIALNKSSTGISCVGAVPYIQNFNMRFSKEAQRSSVIKVTAAVRIPNKVEALTLEHEDGCLEVACNLRRPADVDSAAVLLVAEEASRSLGLTLNHSYVTGPSEQELLGILYRNVSDGRDAEELK